MKEIQNVIAEIEMKVAKMRASLMDVSSENDTLKSEVQRLNEKLGQRENEVLDFKEKYDELKHRQEQNQMIVNNQVDNGAQIDALVREIDDCIGRLKV
ncbi:MAG TPA: hypothetical protein VKY37_07735 [Brumimicrobium sp.]|nr:hypothetical protein [Brumimicrobium sp.]